MSEVLRHRINSKAAILVGGIALGIGGTTAVYEGLGSSEHGVCQSPYISSRLYEADPAAKLNDQSTWRTGIEVDTLIPASAEGLIVGFSTPSHEWRDSNPVAPAEAKKIGLRIGPAAVAFRTSIVAKKGSAACDTPPKSTFSKPESYLKLVEQGDSAPFFPGK